VPSKPPPPEPGAPCHGITGILVHPALPAAEWFPWDNLRKTWPGCQWYQMA